MILLIDNYDSFTYNLYHYIGTLGVEVEVVRNDKITIDDIKNNLKITAIVISPGPCTPNESGICLDVIREFKDKLPILGVCLGHEAIGQVFGGKVVKTHPMHGKTSLISHNSKGVFKHLTNNFKATRYHSLVVEKQTLPDCLEITAQTPDGLIMGLQHKKYNIHGVQFHPESIESEHGHDLLQNFIDLI